MGVSVPFVVSGNKCFVLLFLTSLQIATQNCYVPQCALGTGLNALRSMPSVKNLPLIKKKQFYFAFATDLPTKGN